MSEGGPTLESSAMSGLVFEYSKRASTVAAAISGLFALFIPLRFSSVCSAPFLNTPTYTFRALSGASSYTTTSLPDSSFFSTSSPRLSGYVVEFRFYCQPSLLK